MSEKVILDGKSRQSASRLVNKILRSKTKGFFVDEDWAGVHEVLNELTRQGINWTCSGSEYSRWENGNPPKIKIWGIGICFTNKRGIIQELVGSITAMAAGMVSDPPFKRYDLTAYVS